MTSREVPYEQVLRANTGWFDLDLKGFWQYRDLLVLLVRRDFVARYKQTVLGPLWFIIQPLMMTVIFTIIFGQIAGLSTDGLPPILFYLCGQLAWGYLAQSFTATSSTLLSNAGLFSKVYFPRLIVPVAIVLSNLFAFLIQLATFFAFFVYFKFGEQSGSFGVTKAVMFLPFALVQIATLSLGIGLLMSALTAKYRDLVQLSGFLLQIWMYATPVIYPLASVPVEWRWLMAINPMSVMVEGFRLMLLGTGTVVPSHLVLSATVSVTTLAIGVLVFAKVEKTFVDVV